MKSLMALSLSAGALFAAMALNAQTAGVRSVYILPMAGGLDQFLAGELTREHAIQVVADPKTADAVLTDQLGEGFERKLAKIHPRDEDEDDDAEIHPSFRSSKAKGTVFLVDLKSRNVLWSVYEKPGGSPNRQAAKIVRKLRETNKGK
jgi:hypothetical protein